LLLKEVWGRTVFNALLRSDMNVNGITHVRQEGGILTISDAKFASQQRRIHNREKRNKLKRAAKQLEALALYRN
jgi:hypothetical protein